MKVKKRLVFFAHLLSRGKLTYSCFGNISLRIGKKAIIKNKSVSLETAVEKDFSVFSIRDKLDLIKKTANLSSEWKMHALSYILNPQYNAIFHLHPFYISLLDELGLDLKSEDLEFKYLLDNRIKKLPFYEPGTDVLAREVAGNLGKYPFLILERHGIIVAANSLKEAYSYSIAMETAARKLVYLRLLKKL